MKSFLHNLFCVFLTASIILIGVSDTKALANSILHPVNGVYSIQPQCAPGRELVVQNGDRNSGANVVIWEVTSNLNTGANARWIIEQVQGDWYKIRAAHSGFALNVEDSQNLTTARYSGNNQLFRFIDCGDGYCRIQPNVYPDYSVDVTEGKNANSVNVIVYRNHGGANQKWKLIRL